MQNARQATVDVIASQKRLQQHYEQARVEVNKWERRAQLALQKGNEYLAREALIRKNMHARILGSIRIQLDQEPASIKNLKRNLSLLEAKISEAKTMRISLKARIAAIKPNEHQQSMAGQLDASSAMSVFERMEEKVLQMEALSQAAAELGEVDLESQFAMLDSGSDVDEELKAMKAQLLSSLQSQSQSLGSEPSNTLLDCAAVDDELNDLKRMLDQL